MPGTDTGDLTETSMGLSGKSRDTESLDNTGVTLTAGDSDSVNALRHLEDFADANLLLELLVSPVNLLVDVLGEGLLLGVQPVLVESALDIVVEVLGPDG